MHSLLFAAEKPQSANQLSEEQQRWNALLQTLKDIVQTSQGIQEIAPNVLQIPLKNGLLALVRCGEACRVRSISYKVLFFECEPEWITTARNEV